MDPNLCDVRTCGWAETTINFNVGPRSGRFVIEPTEGVALFTGMLTALIWMILCSLICWIAEHITNAYCELDLLRAILCGSVTLNTKWQHHLIRYSDSISNLPITFNLRRVNCLAVFKLKAMEWVDPTMPVDDYPMVYTFGFQYAGVFRQILMARQAFVCCMRATGRPH